VEIASFTENLTLKNDTVLTNSLEHDILLKYNGLVVIKMLSYEVLVLTFSRRQEPERELYYVSDFSQMFRLIEAPAPHY
jgi:hypothetical protein